MFQRTTQLLVRVVGRYLPDPFLFAVLLTFVVLLMGIGLTPHDIMDLLRYWGNGLFGLLTFAMQMTLVLVTGHVMASSRPVSGLLSTVARAARTPGRAIVITTLVAALASWINWGFGLVVGALLGREMAREVKGVDYRLLIASAYTGFLVWHAGLAGSVPLAIATPGHFLEPQIGVIPVAETIFAPVSWVPVLLLFIALPLLNRAMMPRPEDVVEVDPALFETVAAQTSAAAEPTPADLAERSWLLSALVGLIGLAYLVTYFVGGGSLNLNLVIFIFLIAGIILQGTPRNYLNALNEAVRGVGGIVLQFPFYAGIMGIMTESGLAVVISQWFVDIASARTLPFFTFLSAGVVNLFVPSGGGQWAVQGPVMIPAALTLGADVAKTSMALAWGDAWTNMIQPFWALPALAIAGLGARDIMGYCLMALLVSGVIIGVALLVV
ncbi:short-chain fatty acid transporter [Limnochorda pilosa]|uniref:Short-chain fatty acid transporter n=1 Tax=Limnochorda pilosa TaxID=1555112 RepID=A0A0K2SFL4_LIMPI|nr:short-chain fatty acid transporter [Limnochorda pilosa]BAS25891.1 short-chain fatty acid transporter [Limnochorda pilosa]